MGKHLCVMVVATLLAYNGIAQQTKYDEKDYARTPVWLDMIKDTSANYFETERAFNIYFQHHELPQGENEEIGEHAAKEKRLSKKERKKLQNDNHMRMNVKRYERWHDSMRPYVQRDGRILTPTERIAIWKAEQNKKH